MTKFARLPHLLAVLALTVGLVQGLSDAQAQIDPFGKEQVALEPEDQEQINKAIGTVLERYEPGAVQAWTSPKTDRAGEAILVETFERGGLKCAQVTHRFTAGKGGRTFTAPLCQVEDGTWKLAF